MQGFIQLLQLFGSPQILPNKFYKQIDVISEAQGTTSKLFNDYFHLQENSQVTGYGSQFKECLLLA